MLRNRAHISLTLGRWLTVAVAVLTPAWMYGAAAADEQRGEPPTFDAQLAFRDGRLVVDAQRSLLRLGAHQELFVGCGLTPQTLTENLVQRLDGLYAGLGPVFERLAVPLPGQPDPDPAASDRRAATLTRLRALAQSDDATRGLLALTGPWPEVKAALRVWRQTPAAGLHCRAGAR